MSGPKISVYSLTGRARTVVMGQIRCEQQSVACASQTTEILRGLIAYSMDFRQDMANIQLLMKRVNVGAEQLEKLQQLQKKIKEEATELQQELLAHMPSISAKYTISEEAYAEKQAELKRLQAIKQRAEKLQQQLEEIIAQREENNSAIQTSILNDLGLGTEDDAHSSSSGASFLDRKGTVRQVQESILDDLSGVYSFEIDEEEPDTSFADRKKTAYQKLQEIQREADLPTHILQEVSQAIRKLRTITEIHYLSTFESVTISGLTRKVARYRKELAQQEAEFYELLARYKALCSMANENAQEYTYSKDSVVALSSEVERLEKALVKQHEQAYICECVNQVMSDMGYDLIGERSVTKRNGKRFRNELFSFNDGTAVNVTYSPNGQISMELGGIAREDRLPSAEEVSVLTQDMETFCGEFAEFERRLRDKGVIVGDRIALSPPTADYAAIINVTDYEVEASTQVTEIAASDKKKRTSEKKVMRRNE